MNLNSQKPLKKFIAKNHKTSPSLTEPYQAFLAIDVKMSWSIFIYHDVRMSLYPSFQSVQAMLSVRPKYPKVGRALVS